MPGASPPSPLDALVSSDPARGRILLAVDRAIIALDLQSQLRDAGYRSVGPATSNAAIRALAARGRIDGAVLDIDGVDFIAAEIADLLAQLRVPFVLLTSGR